MKANDWKEQRESAGLTQRDFARELQMPYTRLCNLERGKIVADEEDLFLLQACKAKRVREGKPKETKVPTSKTLQKIERQFAALLTDVNKLKTTGGVMDMSYLLDKLDRLGEAITSFDESKVLELEEREAKAEKGLKMIQEAERRGIEKLEAMRREMQQKADEMPPPTPLLWLEGRTGRALLLRHETGVTHRSRIRAQVIPNFNEDTFEQADSLFAGDAAGADAMEAMYAALSHLKAQVE